MNLEAERAKLAAELRGVDDHAGGMVGDARTKLRELTVPALKRTRVFVGERKLPTRPVLIYFGRHQSGRVFLVTGQPAEFNRMLEAEGLELASGEEALQLARLFLECTRPQDERFLVVESADALPWMPGEDPAKIAAAQEQVAGALKLADARAQADGSYQMEFSVVHDRSLEEVSVIVSAKGVSTSARTVLPKLPLAYAGG